MKSTLDHTRKGVTIIIKEIDYQHEEPILKLLLLADPEIEKITEYIYRGKVFAHVNRSGEYDGVLVIVKIANQTFEIMNVAVAESAQGKGVATALIKTVLTAFASNERGLVTFIVKTGETSENALKLYQKIGFKITEINKDYFITNYAEPIFENGRQLCDQVVLNLNINGGKTT